MTTVSGFRGSHFVCLFLLLFLAAVPVLGGDAPRALPREYDLAQNFPNPFNPSTVIRYAIPVKSHVILTVHNLLGQLVATVVNGDEDAGFHEVRFEAPGLASGVYLYRLEAGKFVQTRKLTLIR
ncbi:MAG TPA: T9SS type A sorting domain-containing protein [Bacteroidota bacterium]|nr:T9SS type A sorting domain-containing protein [Bacteroidota bacterium]